MKKIERALFIILALNALLGIYYTYSQVKTFNLIISSILHKDFQNITYILDFITSAVLSVLLIIGLIICVKDMKFKMNNWIKIYVIYYMLIFVFLGIPNFIVQFFKPSIDSLNFIYFIRCSQILGITTLMLVLSYVYWNKKYVGELTSTNIDVSYKRRVRLINYLIDSFIIGVIVLKITNTLKSNNIQIDYFYVYLLFYFIYYFCCELIFRQTIGKVITNSVVIINSDNSLNSIFIRSISRYIPFEPFSFIIGDREVWHDKLSQTKLVSTNDIQRKKHKELNFLAITSLLIPLLYIRLVYSDSPLSWEIPEDLILWLPVFFLIPLGASVISVRINKNITAIVTTVISIVFFVLTLLFTIFIMNFKYQI